MCSASHPWLSRWRGVTAESSGIDWATGEALAIGTLLLEQHSVRLTGQDVERGTFSHRHAKVVDQKTGDKYTWVNAIEDGQTHQFDVHNSFLSEYGVLGFELGYSFEHPDSLIMWEAQFGDFVNGPSFRPFSPLVSN